MYSLPQSWHVVFICASHSWGQDPAVGCEHHVVDFRDAGKFTKMSK